MVTEVEEVRIEKRRGTRRRQMFRALSHRNYRLFWTGAFLSNCGTWMQAVAQGYLVYQLSHSSFLLGLDGFMATAPGFFLTLASGVFADLVDRRRLLLYTQVVVGLAALMLAVLISAGVVFRPGGVWFILGFSFVAGCCMAIAGPSYQAMTYDLVNREDVANAVALNSTQFQLARVVGPALAGIALRFLSLAGCFYVNGLSFVAVVVGLALVRFPARSPDAPDRPSIRDHRFIWRELLEGIRYVRNRPRVSLLLSIAAVNSLFGAPYMTMVPIFARDIFHMGASGLAWMMGTAGAGAFCGALVLAYLGDFKRKGWSVLGGAIAFGICLICFSLSTNLKWSLVFLFGLGFAIVTSVAVTNTLLQQLVTDKMRGRVMSMFILSFMGAMPIGNLIAGTASHRFGAPRTLAVGGLIIVLYVTVVAIKNKRLRDLH
jgi:MFS family permease